MIIKRMCLDHEFDNTNEKQQSSLILDLKKNQILSLRSYFPKSKTNKN
jgi:hypothetical protein